MIPSGHFLPLLALGLLAVLPDRPERARWLDPEGREWLHGVLELERAGAHIVGHPNPFRALLERYVSAAAKIRFIPPRSNRASTAIRSPRGEKRTSFPPR